MANLLSTTINGNVYVSGYSDVNPTNGSFRFYDGSTFRGGLGLNSWAFSGGSANDLNLYVANDSTLYISTNGINRHYFNSGEAAFKTYAPDLNYKISILGGDQFNAYYGSGAATLYIQYHGNAGGDVRIAGNKFRFDNGGHRLIIAKGSGTMISNSLMDDAIGWNDSYGIYIGSTIGGTYYIYGNGTFYDNGTIRTLIHSGNIGSQSVSYATSAGNSATTSQIVFSDLKTNFPSGGGGGHSFASNHYSMGLDSGNGGWDGPHYRDLIIGYHTGVRIGAHYSGIRFYNNSPTTDANNDGNGDGGEALLMTIGGYVGTANQTDVVVNNNLFANVSMRAPIFYDSNDTGYYLDPNGTSNLLQLNTSTRARWGMPRWWNDRSSFASDENYWTGTNGWGTGQGTWANAWKGGFSGWDIWGTGTDHPQGSGYIHAQGIVSGQHYASSDGGSGYGWMMVGAGDATANRYWLRGKWGGSTSGWVEMITTGNIGSQSVSYASSAGSVAWNSVTSKPSLDYQQEYTFTAPASTDGSGYSWVRISMGGFNSGGDFVRFSIARAIGWNGASPYGGPSMDVVAYSREWHGGQEGAVITYAEHGSVPGSGWVTNAGPRDLAGGGYWFYMRIWGGVDYAMRVYRGSGPIGTSWESTSDPGSVFALRVGVNNIGSTHTGFNTTGPIYGSTLYNGTNAVIHAGNIASQSVSYADESGFASSAGSVEWTSVQNKPATFPPSSHTHPISEVTGLQTALDGKQVAGSYVIANGTSAGNIDSDWGQSFKTFDPIPSGTPPLQSPNIRTINVGENYNRRTQLAFDYASDVAYFRRRTEAGWASWREFIHSGNYSSYVVPKTGGSFTGGIGGTTFDFGDGGYIGGNTTIAGRLTVNAWTTSQRNYSNEWIEFPNYSGLYSPINGAHFYPNNASYGAWRIAGSRNGWNGIEFDGATGNVNLLVSSNTTGFHNNSYGWQFYWDNGTLYCHKNSYGAGTQATVLDSSNFTNWAAAASHTHSQYFDKNTLAPVSVASDVVSFYYDVSAGNKFTAPRFLVNNHSDNTKGYRIYNTSSADVSAMFVNSSNQLVIAAGAVDQINLNKKVLVNGVALGVNVAPSATAGRIDASNDIVAYSSSDERLKENITPIENALDKVKSLTGVEFDWKPEYKHAHGYEGHDTGIIAQQVEAVMPSAVRTNDTGFLAVRYEKLIGLLIEANKELAARVEELEKKLS